jgi:MFS family permease
VVPQKERARWVGIVMGSYAAGFALGPILGGALYDWFGYAAPFMISAVLGSIALVFAVLMVPETRTQVIRNREKLEKQRLDSQNRRRESLWESLPEPFYIFAALLFTDFVIIFAFAFVEPQMVFYFYDDLGWSTVQFGVVVALYGGFIVIGQALLGRMSDRIGRKPVILLGTALYGTFFLGLVLFDSYLMLILIAVIAGLGEALMLPALSAFYIDITPEQHRSRVIGIKESAASLGGVAGPLLVIAVSPYLDPKGVFMVGFILVALTFIIGLLLLREPGDLTRREKGAILAYSQQRSLLAQATLQGIVTSARGVRFQRKRSARRVV